MPIDQNSSDNDSPLRPSSSPRERQQSGFPDPEQSATASDHASDSPVKKKWDAAVDPPASVLVIGGGPVGIEAALYARFLGYSVAVVEQRRIGAHLRRWGGQAMFEDWRQLTSPLGIAALEAQGTLRMSSWEAIPTLEEYVDSYLIPVAKTDLLSDCIHIHSRVSSIGRWGGQPPSALTDLQKSRLEFRVLIDSRQRGEFAEIFEIILDCSGLSRYSGLASGGEPACGESAALSDAGAKPADSRLMSGKLTSAELAKLSGKAVILFGAGLEACANALDWQQHCASVPGSRLTWLLPRSVCKPAVAKLPWQMLQDLGISRPLDASMLPGIGLTTTLDSPAADNERIGYPSIPLTAQIENWSERIECLRSSPPQQFVALDVWGIDSIEANGDGGWSLRVQTRLDETLPLHCDYLLHCAASRADWRMVENLKVEPRQDFLTSEPHYYVLGRKSRSDLEFACLSDSIRQAREQIRLVFALIGGRPTLDLYASFNTSWLTDQGQSE